MLSRKAKEVVEDKKRVCIHRRKLHLKASTFAHGRVKTLGKEQLKFLVRFMLQALNRLQKVVRLFSAQDKSSVALKPAKGAEVKANPSTDELSEITLWPKVCSGLIPKVMLILPRDKRAVAVPPQLLVLNQHDYGRDQIASAGRKPSDLPCLCACWKMW